MSLIDVAEHLSFEIGKCGIAGRSPQIRDRFFARNDAHALMLGREKSAVKYLRAGVGQMFGQHHVRGKISVLSPQCVADPSANTGHGHRGGTRVHRQRGLKVFDDVGVHRADHAQVIGQRTKVREKLAYQEP